MTIQRTDRINSLLKEVISDVILKEVKNPHLPPLLTITRAEVTKDLHHAKVYVSVIGTQPQKQKAIEVLQQAAGFIALRSSKQVKMRFFPELLFYLDESVEKQARIEEILTEIHAEERTRHTDD